MFVSELIDYCKIFAFFRIFQKFSKDSRIFQNIAELFQNIIGFSKMLVKFQNISQMLQSCSHRFQNVLESSGDFYNIPKCFGNSENAPEFSKILCAIFSFVNIALLVWDEMRNIKQQAINISKAFKIPQFLWFTFRIHYHTHVLQSIYKQKYMQKENL